jgi:isopentenyl diphosphate isomerase/L-lactate dehydrogenase-like FMN-dependent dehydrogenase
MKNKDLNYYYNIARNMLEDFSNVCDGKPDYICTPEKFGATMGLGGAGQGKTFETNYNTLHKYRLRMQMIKAHHEPEMSISIFGKELTIPVMGASVSGVKLSLNDVISEEEFYWGLLKGARDSGCIAMVGNTPACPDDLGVTVIEKNDGWGIPIFKPHSQEWLVQLFQLAEELNVLAVGVDLDGVGSQFWNEKQLYRKSEKDIQELVDSTGKPVIFKGIMNVEDAVKVVDSGADACYVSNHGGRPMDCGQGVAEVLPDIAMEVSGKIPILADGAVRTGFDVLMVLALGADVALIGRPLALMSVAGGYNAVKLYFEYVKHDLRLAMIMTGCDNLKEATMDILSKGLLG